MIYRYKSKTGQCVDVDVSGADRAQVDAAMFGRGFTACERTGEAPLMSFGEFTQAMGGAPRTKQLLGPQPGGTVGPVASSRPRADGAVVVRL